MANTLKYILIGGVSFLVGGISGYFVCKKRFQAKFDEELSEKLNEELNTIRKVHEESSVGKRKDISPVDEACDMPKEDVIDAISSKPIDIDKVKEMILEEFPDEDLNEYRVTLVVQKMLDIQSQNLTIDEADAELKNFLAEMQSPPEDEPEEDDDEGDIFDEDAEEDTYTYNDIMDEYKGRIEVIPNSDYRNLPPTFEFVTYHYFEEDDILIDDVDLIIEDIDGVVGDALVHFDEEEDDADTVYLINGDYGLAIEIVRLHSSYAEWNGWGR